MTKAILNHADIKSKWFSSMYAAMSLYRALAVLLLSVFSGITQVEGVYCTFATVTNVLNITEDCTIRKVGDNRSGFQTISPVLSIHGAPLWFPQKKLTISQTKLRHFQVSEGTKLVLLLAQKLVSFALAIAAGFAVLKIAFGG